MNKTVSLESVRKLVSKKTGKDIQVLRETRGCGLYAFIDSELSVKELAFDMDANEVDPVVCKDLNGNDLEKYVHTILFTGGDLVKEVIDGIYKYRLRLDGALNGILVIDDKLADKDDIEFLEEVENLK